MKNSFKTSLRWANGKPINANRLSVSGVGNWLSVSGVGNRLRLVALIETAAGGGRSRWLVRLTVND